MKIVLNKDANPPRLEAHIEGVLLRLPKEDAVMRVNSNGTEYSYATVQLTDNAGNKSKVPTIIWKGSIDAEIFSVGDEVEIHTPIEGEYAGRTSTMHLSGSAGIDLNAFGLAEIDLDAWKAENLAADKTQAPVTVGP